MDITRYEYVWWNSLNIHQMILTNIDTVQWERTRQQQLPQRWWRWWGCYLVLRCWKVFSMVILVSLQTWMVKSSKATAQTDRNYYQLLCHKINYKIAKREWNISDLAFMRTDGNIILGGRLQLNILNILIAIQTSYSSSCFHRIAVYFPITYCEVLLVNFKDSSNVRLSWVVLIVTSHIIQCSRIR